MRFIVTIFLFAFIVPVQGQSVNSIHDGLTSLPGKDDSISSSLKPHAAEKYLKQASNKIELYDKRISSKTKKTLKKLVALENKIKQGLDKTNPALASRLFSPTSISFQKMLQQYESGETALLQKTASFDAYRDKLQTSIKYLQKLEAFDSARVEGSLALTEKLEKEIAGTDVIQKMIKERKAALLQAGLQNLGKSKYLSKISKESFYYTETLKNYKELFHDSKKPEKLAFDILNKIPAFQKFFRENNALASLFGAPGASASTASLAGLQTRASVNAIIQGRLASGGPNAQEVFKQQISVAQAELSKLKDKVMKAGGGNSDMEMPDFKPNMQKTKTFKQRLEYGLNMQMQKNNSWTPGGADIGLSLGYKLNDKGTAIGIGASYKLGLGSIEKIKISHEGLGLRSYFDWKGPFGSSEKSILKSIFLSGGYEMNYNSSFKNIASLQNADAWQRSALIGMSKKIPMKTKWTKGAKMQLLYDVMHAEHVPVGQPLVFRIGYEFNK